MEIQIIAMGSASAEPINAAVGDTEMPGDGNQASRIGDHLTISTD
jgi:hypothetical protein